VPLPLPPPRIDEIVGRAGQEPPRLGSGRLVCIDGPAGSGKTTLAARLVDALAAQGRTVAALHMDDFYEGWSGLQIDLEPRLLSQVFEPLSEDRPTRWQRFDWHRDEFGAWHDLLPTEYLVVEGCGSGALAYEPYRSLLVFVEAERGTRLRRGIERDGPAVEPHWLAWMEREQAHFELNHTRERADLLYSTENL
jgi:uridine kinase